jgi:hypothetical protein
MSLALTDMIAKTFALHDESRSRENGSGLQVFTARPSDGESGSITFGNMARIG